MSILIYLFFNNRYSRFFEDSIKSHQALRPPCATQIGQLSEARESVLLGVILRECARACIFSDKGTLIYH